MHFLISVRSEQKNMESDLQRVEQLRWAILNNGFAENEDPRLSWMENPDEKIWVSDSDFVHPADIIAALKDLNARCIHYQQNDTNCSSDCDRLNRWPILSQNQILYTILSFEKPL